MTYLQNFIQVFLIYIYNNVYNPKYLRKSIKTRDDIMEFLTQMTNLDADNKLDCVYSSKGTEIRK